MISKKNRLAACRLYLILDTQVCDRACLWEALKAAVKGGIDIVQLRDKCGSAREVLAFATKIQSYLADRIPFIVNDRADIARLSGASGVHVGQDDLPVTEARKILGTGKIIGTSCQTMEHLRRAIRDGADYVGFGSVFKTQTKPDRSPMSEEILRRAAHLAREVDLPLFAIGGIGRSNLSLVRASGVEHVAVCRDILLAQDVRFTVGELRRGLAA